MKTIDVTYRGKVLAGVIEEGYGLDGYRALVDDEMAGLNTLIEAADLPSKSFELAPDPETEGQGLTLAPEESAGSGLSIDLKERLKPADGTPAPAGPAVSVSRVANLKNRLSNWLRRKIRNRKQVQPSGTTGGIYVGKQSRLPDSLLKIHRETGDTVLRFAPGLGDLSVRSGLRVPMIRWDSGSQSVIAASSHEVYSGTEEVAVVCERKEDLPWVKKMYPAIRSCEDGEKNRIEIPEEPEGEPEGGWPKISVVTVSYNQVDFLEESILSILDQEYPNLEYIVVDGASTDGCVDILERYRDRIDTLIIEPDTGQSNALNKGISKATGEMVNWLCSDDLLEPGSLHRIGRACRESKADMIAGGCRVVDGEGKQKRPHHSGFPFYSQEALSFGDLISFHSVWQQGHYFYQPEVFFSRDLWERSGAYLREDLYYAMDYEMYLRFALVGATLWHIPDFLASSRQHEAQKTQHAVPGYLPTIRSVVADFQNAFADKSSSTFKEGASTATA